MITMLKKALLAILGILVVGVAAYGAVLVMSDAYKVTLGQHTFNIPKQYSRQGAIPQWLLTLPGLDDGSRDYMLTFPAEEIAAEVHGYKKTNGKYKEDIRAILAVLTHAEIKRYQDSGRYRDLWYAEDSYRERIIESYSDRPWFRVYRKLDYPRLWTVLKKSPEAERTLPSNVSDFWVGSCRLGNSPLTGSGKLVDCQSYVFYDDIAIDFYISEQNLDVIDDVRAFLRSKIESWNIRNVTAK